MQVYSNITSFAVWKNYRSNLTSMRRSMARLSSGLRIGMAGDDPSGLAMSERMRAQIRNTAAASSNVENKINYLQTADSWLQKIHDLLGRMGELAIMANDGTRSATDRENLEREFEQMQKEIQRITTGATAAGRFNGLYLFRGGTGVASTQNDLIVGAGTVGGATLTNLNHDGASVGSNNWLATYNEIQMEWTIRNVTNGDEFTLAAAPDAGAEMVFDDAIYGFRLVIHPPQFGTYGSGDTINWTTVAYVPPVMGSTGFQNVSQSGTASFTAAGTGEDVSNSSWAATYDAEDELWTVQRNGVTMGTIAAAPESGGSAVFEGANGFQITINAPTSGSYATGTRLTWSNTGAVLGSAGFVDTSSSTTFTAGNTLLGDGSGITSGNWLATYDAVTQTWAIRCDGTLVDTLSAAPNAGGVIDLEGANGFRFTINAPTAGQFNTGDRISWTNTAHVDAVAGSASLTDASSATTGSGSNAVAGDGSGITTANWSATYSAVSQLWTIQRNGVNYTTLAADPDAGGSVTLEGANGTLFTIQAPTSGQYTTNDRFTWANTAQVLAGLGRVSMTDTGDPTTGSGSNSTLGTGHGITTASWTATYDDSTEQWTIRRNGTIAGTLSAAPDAGGSINLEGANGFRFTVDAPTSGQYNTGDRLSWSNTGYAAPVAGALSYTDNSAATNGSAGNGLLGTGLGVTSASWTATYDAVNQEWTVRRAGVVMGTISAAPNGGGQIDLEGANGFRFTVDTPASGQYNTGDRFSWTNSAYEAPILGSVMAIDTNPSTAGTSGNTQLGLGTDIDTASWTATYDAVARLWTVRRNGVATATISSAPNAGGSVDLEGANGFRYRINAPTSGQYNTGDRFSWTTTRLLPPTLGTGLTLTPAGSPGGVAATVTVQGDGYDVTTAQWRATYDAGDGRWEIRNMDTGVVAGYLNAGPEDGGTLADIEGSYGFTFAVAAPSSSSYSTGDYFEWQNTAHVASDPGTGYYTDATTISVSLQVGPDSNQVFEEAPILLEADSYELIGSYATYSYGSVNMTLLGDTRTWVRWASLICPQQLRIEEQAKAQAAVDKINIGVDYLSSIRATIGAEMNRMTETLQALRNYEENMRTSESRIRDTDVALETTQYAKFNILNRINVAMLAQANTLPSGVLRMLGVG